MTPSVPTAMISLTVSTDIMSGGSGNDAYRIARGDGALGVGQEKIFESAFSDDVDKILFTDANLGDLYMFVGEFDISVGVEDSLGTVRWLTKRRAVKYDGSDDQFGTPSMRLSSRMGLCCPTDLF